MVVILPSIRVLSKTDNIALGYSAVQSQKAVTAYFTNKHLLPSVLAAQYTTPERKHSQSLGIIHGQMLQLSGLSVCQQKNNGD